MATRFSLVLKLILLFFVFFGSAIYWGGMAQPSYGSVRTNNTVREYGLHRYCTGTVNAPNQLVRTCQRYQNPEVYLETSVALYGVWIFLDIVIMILLAYSPCIKARKRNQNKLFVYNLAIAIITLFAFVFLWAHFIFFSSKLKSNNRGLKFGPGFGASIAGFFILSFVYMALMMLPIICDKLDFPEEETPVVPQQILYVPQIGAYM